MLLRLSKEKKLNIYLLDDGGTEQKRTQSDPEARQEALSRNRELKYFCQNHGIQYLTRDKNKNAKAGNINSALPKTQGDLILILDADHVPSKNFLQNTVGPFLKDPKLFLVQTPHFFYNLDPVEKNLRTFNHIPGENEMFYRGVQPGLDFWNSSMFCGSAALLKRQYLEKVGWDLYHQYH